MLKLLSFPTSLTPVLTHSLTHTLTMMRSNYQDNNHHDDDDDDDFSPNPFRSTGTSGSGNNTGNPSNGGMDFFETPNPMSHHNNNHHNNQNYYAQPDPNTGMVGTLPPQLYPQQQQQPPPPQPAATYLTGTMDQLGGPNKSTGAAGAAAAPPPNFLVSFLTSCCLPYHQIQSLFDVDTIDIYIRIKAAIWNFHQPNYFRLSVLGARRSSSSATSLHHPNDDDAAESTTTKGPDLYGPIWISMTCMFILGITANINDYYRHVQQQQQQQKNHNSSSSNNNSTNYHSNDETVDQEFEYDLTHLLNAMYLCFTYTFGISTFFWLVCICMGFHNSNHNNHTSPSSPTSTTMSSGQYLSWVYWVCHYGYSLVPILIGTCLAWILPYTLYHWIVLGTATFCSSLFIIRNLSTPLLEQDIVSGPDPHDPLSNNGTFGTTTTTSTHAKAAPILLSILGVHFTFLLVLKLLFYP